MKKWLVMPLLLYGLFVVGGCAVMGMHGMRHRGGQIGSQNESVVVTLNVIGAKAILEVPPIFAGESALLSLRLNRAKDGQAIAGAQVSMEIIDLDYGVGNGAGHDDSRTQSSVRLANESAAGVYELSHTFTRQGQYEIIAQVQLDGAEEEGLIELSAKQRVVPKMGHIGHARSVSRDALGVAAIILMMGLMMGGSWLF